jgi:hypothetical protein
MSMLQRPSIGSDVQVEYVLLFRVNALAKITCQKIDLQPPRPTMSDVNPAAAAFRDAVQEYRKFVEHIESLAPGNRSWRLAEKYDSRLSKIIADAAVALAIANGDVVRTDRRQLHTTSNAETIESKCVSAAITLHSVMAGLTGVGDAPSAMCSYFQIELRPDVQKKNGGATHLHVSIPHDRAANIDDDMPKLVELRFVARDGDAKERFKTVRTKGTGVADCDMEDVVDRIRAIVA